MHTTAHHPPTPSTDVAPEAPQLLREVRRVLENSGFRELHQVEIQVHGQEVVLRGTVTSYFRKQVAQELVKRLPGVERLRNELVVTGKQERES